MPTSLVNPLLNCLFHPLTALDSLLVLLHLRRPSAWERPTLLDCLISSPVQYFASLTYRLLLVLRGSPFRPPRDKNPIRVVCLSDTHNLTLPGSAVPRGDLLIHCGDLAVDGTVDEIQRQVDWLVSDEIGGKFKYVVVVGGNHDGWLDRDVRRRMRRQSKGEREGKDKAAAAAVDWKGIEYLEGRLVTLRFEEKGVGGRSRTTTTTTRELNVFGRGDVPRCGGDEFAFQYDREEHPWKGAIPDETDVLVTHGPPRHHGDLGLGCDGLLEEVWRVKPKLHVFGHTHWGYGKEAVYFDECQKAFEILMSKPARGPFWDLIPSSRWLDVLKIVKHGMGSLLWKWIMAGPGSNNGGLMVNAAVMYGNTGKLRNKVTVVDL